MSANPKQADSLHDLLEEHAGLRNALELVTEAIAARRTSPAAMAEMIDQGVQRVLTHFRCEETSGHLTVAAETAPHLAVRADGLIQEHEELRRQLREIQRHARTAEASPSWWQQLEAMWGSFLRQFRAHEDAENRLLQMAFNEDIGAED